ncbi:uncharacterized protein Bfra_008210 [Botrytis fragariae]|uniref:Uncharacterized protein n=1 Tax=Botrytis fragariae TaxID=1964551 RepID=A0A8H6ASG2_9HELO|nr:uncharacterized protein Bfra_008210 [Botrytis fragariae]KAF5872933.1 hypothetical protein Bfra_008210 [Botrytis fragariae]
MLELERFLKPWGLELRNGCKRAQGCVELIIIDANEAKGPGHRSLKHTTFKSRTAIGLNFRR